MSHSRTVLNPDGEAAARRGLMQPALHDHLMERVVSAHNLRRAWKRVKANHGAPGIDGITVEEFPQFVRQHWATIR